MSLLHCYLTTIDYGLRFGGGIGEGLGSTTMADWNSQAFIIRFFFDIAFFLLITTIILNVVFGIIIDSFA
jgi:inositol 1,4,5-triphosphate receptor type 1